VVGQEDDDRWASARRDDGSNGLQHDRIQVRDFFARGRHLGFLVAPLATPEEHARGREAWPAVAWSTSRPKDRRRVWRHDVGEHEPWADRPLHEAVDELKRARIRAALAQSGGNQTRAAALLGMRQSNLSRLMKSLGLGYPSPNAVIRAVRRASP
jgi:DNA-binding NtrC family response regulator